MILNFEFFLFLKIGFKSFVRGVREKSIDLFMDELI